MASMRTRGIWHATLAGLLVGTAFATAACGASRTYVQGDLDEAVAKHHMGVKWGPIGQAAGYVHPDVQTDFVRSWSERLGDREVVAFEVLSSTMDPEMKNALVVVQITWTEGGVRVQKGIFEERWVRGDGGRWSVEKPVFGDDMRVR